MEGMAGEREIGEVIRISVDLLGLEEYRSDKSTVMVAATAVTKHSTSYPIR